jgi:hypothetical protein
VEKDFRLYFSNAAPAASPLLNGDLDRAFGAIRQFVRFVSGEVGLADLGNDFPGNFVGYLGNGEHQDVALRNGRIQAGAVRVNRAKRFGKRSATVITCESSEAGGYAAPISSREKIRKKGVARFFSKDLPAAH